MKPGKPLKRTELKRKTSLINRTPMPRGSSLHRTGSINSMSAKRRRDNRTRAVAVSALRLHEKGWCPRCGQPGVVTHGHERVRRSQDFTAMLRPDVLICDPCNSAVAASPRVSCWNGWAVTAKWPHDPALEPWQARALDGSIVSFEIPTEEAA